jgi:hypothetical protein
VERVPGAQRTDQNLTLVEASLLDLSDAVLAQLVSGCGAVASCLGHTMTLQGMFGPPRRLVADAVRRLCRAVKTNQPETPVRFVLMNTAGNHNWDLDEPRTFGEKVTIGIMRSLLPPQADNEAAAEVLRSEIGQDDPFIEWAAVRPDSLIDEDVVTDYTLHPSPTRSPIFDLGQTSRINVGYFMAELMTNDEIWTEWKGRMPVIYNRGEV